MNIYKTNFIIFITLLIILIILTLTFTLIFIKNCKSEKYISEKYFMLDDNYKISAGLSHHMSNMNAFLSLAQELKKTPILPKFYLAGHHNNNKTFRSNFSKYLEIPKNVLTELPKNTPKDQVEIYLPKSDLIRLDNYYQKNLPKSEYKSFDWNKELFKKAQKIVDQMKRPILCMHVRRGDMLNIKNKLINDTSTENIKNVLNKIKKEKKFETVYIMTNENDKKYFDALKNFNIKLFFDFPDLEKIQKNDNYELFVIENCILKLSDIKVSTLKTNRKIYDYYLSEEPGWQ